MFAVAIGVLMIFSVSQHALAYPVEVPADYEGDVMLLMTPQIVLAAKVCERNLHGVPDLTSFGQTQVAVLLMLPLGLGCTKASVVFFYLRIFTTTKRSKTYGLFVASIVIIVAMMIGFFLSTLFECGSHISAMFQSTVAMETYPPHSDSYDYGFAISEFITDVVILAMPVPLVSPSCEVGSH